LRSDEKKPSPDARRLALDISALAFFTDYPFSISPDSIKGFETDCLRVNFYYEYSDAVKPKMTAS
jgi:hypothetical protein